MKHIVFIRMVSFIMALFICVAPAMAANDEAVVNEYLVKAAFIYNFAKFVEWPHCKTDDCGRHKLVIGLYGWEDLRDDVQAAMDSIEGKTVGNRIIDIKYLSEPVDIFDCQIAYIFSSKTQDIETVLDVVKGHTILMVSDIDNFVDSGGMIELMKVKGKFRFAINRKAALASSIQISSQLLKLEQYVVE